MKKNYFVALALLFASTLLYGQESVTFDTNDLNSGRIDEGAGSMNLCWLLDSDLERPRTNSMQQRINEMKIGSLRFPYGHLANNYLWDTPPYGGVLEPKIATSSVSPGNWTWSTNPDGSFIKDMDFDEFMGLCSATNTAPLVVVNVLSSEYTNGPSKDTLKKVAVEWVKYAKLKGYDVAYWQIGNEMDHHQDDMSRSEYVDRYVDFVRAMKAEDPTIKCGPGILSSAAYFNDIMARDASTVDFTSAHQYLFGQSWGDYAGWREDNISGLVNNINSMQNAVNNSAKPDLEILVTESNAWGCWTNSDNTALYKGLAWFDLLMEQQRFEDVKYTYMWNSHTPWGGETKEESDANAWFNNDANELTAMGWAPYILNHTRQEKFMNPNIKVNGKTHSYGAYTPGTGDMVIYLMNKDNVGHGLRLYGSNSGISFGSRSWTGAYVTWTLNSNSGGAGNRIRLNDPGKTETAETTLRNFVIYPNPASGHSYIEYELIDTSEVVLRIFNIHGKVLQESYEGSQQKGHYVKALSTSKLSQGIFFVELSIRTSAGSHDLSLQKFIRQ